MLMTDARHLTDTTPLLHGECVLLRFLGKKIKKKKKIYHGGKSPHKDIRRKPHTKTQRMPKKNLTPRHKDIKKKWTKALTTTLGRRKKKG